MELTYKNMHDVLMDCLYREEELVGMKETGIAKAPEGAVMAEGVMNMFAFHPERLESHREDVKSMLDSLDRNFHVDGGGGWSLMNMPFRADGFQWGEQRDADLLCALGQALGYAKYALPRKMWMTLPGGMPYVQIDTREKAHEEPSAG